MDWNPVSNAESWPRAVDGWISHLEDFGRRPWTIVQYRSEAKNGNRIQKLIRDAMRSVDDPRQSAAAVARIAEEQGLQPAEAPEPLPVITVDDIHLVCWQAITPD